MVPGHGPREEGCEMKTLEDSQGEDLRGWSLETDPGKRDPR